MADSRYSPLARASEETDPESSPHEQLLPTSRPQMNLYTYKFPTTYSITFKPVIIFRVLSTILALTTFIILVIDGNEEFIAADIFLMVIILTNIFMVVHYSISHIFKVTVELRHQQPWKGSLGTQYKPKVSMYFDIVLALTTFLCLIIGNAIKRWGGAWKAAVIIGYIVVLLQILVAVPYFEHKNLTLTAKLSDSTGKPPNDTKDPVIVNDTERGSARRRTTESEEPIQSAEDLV